MRTISLEARQSKLGKRMRVSTHKSYASLVGMGELVLWDEQNILCFLSKPTRMFIYEMYLTSRSSNGVNMREGGRNVDV